MLNDCCRRELELPLCSREPRRKVVFVAVVRQQGIEQERARHFCSQEHVAANELPTLQSGRADRCGTCERALSEVAPARFNDEAGDSCEVPRSICWRQVTEPILIDDAIGVRESNPRSRDLCEAQISGARDSKIRFASNNANWDVGMLYRELPRDGWRGVI